jgi:hypothetical protein
MGFTCATFKFRSDGFVSDLWVSAPALSPKGEMLCPGDRIIYYKGIKEESLFESNLECAFEGFFRVSEWACERGDIVRLSGSGDDLK